MWCWPCSTWRFLAGDGEARKWNLHLCNQLTMITRQREGQHTSPTGMNYFSSLQSEAKVSWLVLLISDIPTALSTASSYCPQSFTGVRLMDHHGNFTSRAQEKEKERPNLCTSGRQRKWMKRNHTCYPWWGATWLHPGFYNMAVIAPGLLDNIHHPTMCQPSCSSLDFSLFSPSLPPSPFSFFKANTGIRTNLRHKNMFWDTWVTNSYYLSNHAFKRSSLCKRESGPSLQVRGDFGDGGEPQQPSLSANFSPELTVLSHPTKPPRVRPEKQGDTQAVLHQEAENSWNCSRDHFLEKCSQINEAVGSLWVYQ